MFALCITKGISTNRIGYIKGIQQCFTHSKIFESFTKKGENTHMELTVGNSYHGFELSKERFVKELKSKAYIFNHTKSGARLIYLSNDDDNKVFSITFKTPPEDSTGLPHILEHSVLCGSRKFPSKEPFVELEKGSLNTFLNAMTFSDKTMYPIASRNPQDFENLMDVYLDAVFYPNIYNKPEIFMQEGWHYHIEDHDKPLVYNGVVYNEMKGAFSSPEQTLHRKIQESLYPDTAYGLESGGDPEVIPELTYEQFINFHKKYYHPSNSYIFMYGDGNILEHLKFLNNEYLNNFDGIEIDSEIMLQKPFSKPKELKVEYPISSGEAVEDKTFFSLNFSVGQSTDTQLVLAFAILADLLLETPAAPLKKALLKARIGKDVYGNFNDTLLQPTFSITIKNSNPEKEDEFVKIVFDTLNDLAQNGIDKKLIEAAINIQEFKLREADYGSYPKGLFYCILAMTTWLHHDNPTELLEYEPLLDNVKKALTSSYFEDLIKNYLLNNDHRSLIVMTPKKGLAEERNKNTLEELMNQKESLSEQEIANLIANTKNLMEYQAKQDSPEEIEKIPLLSPDDIENKAKELPLEELKKDGLTILKHSMFTNEIGYVNLLFDTSTIPQDLLPYSTLLSYVLGRINTKNYSYEDLSNEINLNTGGINFSTRVYSEKDTDKNYHQKFVVNSKSLVDKAPQLFDLIGEIIGNTRFDNKDRLKEIIQEIKSRVENKIFNQGHSIAINRVLSYFSPVGQLSELTGGLSFYKFIAELEKNYDSQMDNIIDNLQKISAYIFNKNNLLISITSSEDDFTKIQQLIPGLYEIIGEKQDEPVKYNFDFGPHNEGLMIPGNVQYVAKAHNFRKEGHDYTGGIAVLRTIINLDYLWNKIRVQGGAYGVFSSFAPSGNVFFCSYRDPNLKETLSVYDKATDYVANFNATDREMTKYIIGTISKLDSPMTPSMKGEQATSNYIKKITQEDIQRERDEVLNTRQHDIQQLADIIRAVMKENHFCVVGNEGKIRENKDIFNEISEVFE